MDVDDESTQCRMGASSLRRRSLVLLAVLVVAAAAITLSPALVGAASPVDAADAARNATGPAPHEHPDNPRPPDEIDRREDVVNSEEYPYSAIGQIRSGYSNSGSGVLVSEYHVLTNAHVVASDSGEPNERITFRPGWRNTPTSNPSAPYGQAQVTDVEVDSVWDGDGPEGDLALLTLDRPVGRLAGHMDLEGWTDHSGWELQHAGYLANVTGDRQLTSDPWTLESGGSGSIATFQTCAAMGEGDSGSPIWRTVDGRPTLLGIHSWARSDIPACASHKNEHVKLTPATVDLVESWMAEDEAPESKADLQSVDSEGRPSWVDGPDPIEGGPLASLDDSVTLRTLVYNEGPASLQTTSGMPVGETATVQFYVKDGSTWKPVCSSVVSMGPYDSDQASCTADGLPDVDRTQPQLVFGVAVDADDDVEEYDDVSGMIEVLDYAEFAPDTDYVLTDTQAPQHAAPGSTFRVSTVATNRYSGTGGRPGGGDPPSTVAVEADLTHGSCAPESTEVSTYLSETVTANCTVAPDTSVEETTLTISTEHESVTRSIDLTDVDDDGEANFEIADAEVSGLPVGLEIPAIEPGEEITVSTEVENVGSEAGARYIHLELSDDFDSGAVSSDYDWTPTCTNRRESMGFEATRLLELDPGQRAEVSFRCELPYDVEFPSDPDNPDEVPLLLQVGVRDEPNHVTAPPVRRFVDQLSDDRRLNVTPGGDPAFQVESVSGPDNATVGEPARANATIYNDGSPAEQIVELVANGTVLDRSEVELDRYERGKVSFAFTPESDAAGVTFGTVRTGQESQSVPLVVEGRGIDVSIADAPGNVTHATERIAVEATIEAEHGTDGSIPIEFVANGAGTGSGTDGSTGDGAADGTVVANRTVALGPGASTTVELAGPIRPAGSERLSLTVRAADTSSTSTVEVAPPLNESFGGDSPRPHGEAGLYRDFDGDGELGHTDVVEFFSVQHRPSVQAYSAYFDFNGNGGVGHGDVIALFEAVAQQPL